MPRDVKRRYQKYKIVGLRFSDGKTVMELGRAYNRKEVSLYIAKDEVWNQIENIFNNLVSVNDIALDNGSQTISIKVEDVVFEKVHEEEMLDEQEDDNGEEIV